MFWAWGFWLMMSWLGYVVGLFWWRHQPIQWADIVAWSFIGFLAVTRVFRALDWLSSIYASKVTQKNSEYRKDFQQEVGGLP